MNTAIKRIILTAALAGMAVYGYVSLRGPQGIPALRAKWDQIQQEEERIANLARDNQYRKQRIDRLKYNSAEQDLEIRRHLKLQKKGETSFILPEASTPKGPAAQPAANPAPAGSEQQ